ncbi:MAG: pyridoxamine 5'-phosphate oxidase family protein [Kofleriaceae bacterium]|nr:pyridoxamine 5'-phosphate oxidase family protein [Kofleriaceae bacterium]
MSWRPLAKVWFTEGKYDPRITVICVTPSEGYDWDTKHNRVVTFAKIVAGAVTGKTLDDSIEGAIHV